MVPTCQTRNPVRSQFGQLFMFWKQFSGKARTSTKFFKSNIPQPRSSQIPKRSLDMAYWDADATFRSFWEKAYHRVARSETLSPKRKQAEICDERFSCSSHFRSQKKSPYFAHVFLLSKRQKCESTHDRSINSSLFKLLHPNCMKLQDFCMPAIRIPWGASIMHLRKYPSSLGGSIYKNDFFQPPDDFLMTLIT